MFDGEMQFEELGNVRMMKNVVEKQANLQNRQNMTESMRNVFYNNA
ncbi:hypothetical protein QSI_4207 [Clostridioides difficile P28]|nr:hypothetical protein QSI_4207 [Clostridioides difficile P28]